MSGGTDPMDEQTRKLLEECSLGCKMAVESFEQVREYARDPELKNVIDRYTQKHRRIEEEVRGLLKDSGNEEKTPRVMASTLSWFTTEVRLSVNSDNTRIARLLMDGGNMGIKTIGEKAHQYGGADRKAKDLAQKIIRTEEELMKKLQKFL